MRRAIAIDGFLVRYDTPALDRWGTDLEYIAALLECCGSLGVDPARFYNQSPRKKGHQHFCELHTACHLVRSGIPPDAFQYENYYLSGEAFRRAVDRRGKKVCGTERLRGALRDWFFSQFDTLVGLNREGLDKKRRDCLHVDFSVTDHRQRQIRFIECKHVYPDGRREPIARHQRTLLAMLAHLIREHPKQSLKEGWTGKVEIAFLVPSDSRLTSESLLPLTVEFENGGGQE